jgi:two-component system, LytTR family, response regulator AlgR
MRTLIVDDEALARGRLRGLLQELDDVELVGEAAHGLEAMELAQSLQPDLLLLDIQMPGMGGLEVARHVAGFENPPAVVFCTAYDEHALAAFEANAVDYVVKPVRLERLRAAIDKARRYATADLEQVNGSRQRTHLCARLRGTLRLIPVDDVRFLQAEEKYVVVHHAGGEDLIEDSLKSLEAEFGERFLRIHRNCLVARSELVELRRTPDAQVRVQLRHHDEPLEVSRRCVASLRDAIRTM